MSTSPCCRPSSFLIALAAFVPVWYDASETRGNSATVVRRAVRHAVPSAMINPFPTLKPVYFAYFSYGAAFLFLTFSIGTKNMKGSNLRFAAGLAFLALFGLSQGVREFIEIYPLIEGEHLTPREMYYIQQISTWLLTASYLFLFHFGLSFVHHDKRKRRHVAFVVYPVLLLVGLLYLYQESVPATLGIERLAYIAARNILGVTASLLTAYSMIRYSSSREIRGLTHVISRNLYYAGVVFAVYAFLSTTFFADIARHFDVPKEPFRAGAAVLIAYFIIRALNIFDVEMRNKVEAQARELVQTEHLASLGKLAAGIAHEINNPLTNASLGIQLARKKLSSADPASFGEHLDAVEKSIDRAASIAQDLLQFSRGWDAEVSPVDLNKVIEAALGQVRHKTANIRIETELTSVPAVRGDRVKLEQVFINILSNAEEAMPHGGRIFISTNVHADEVEAIVSDTGSGIKQDFLSKVFDPFFTTKEVGSGTGLGLYITYGIIKQHHGTIQISSEAGKGTTVSVKLPLHHDRSA
jgi:two-component system NtrC family sensor kinase